jgi:hypothetical protein
MTLADLGGGAWGFKGYTTKAGTYLVTVTATVKGNVVRQRLALKVEALPIWAKGTFNGYIWGTGTGEPGTGGTNGLATVTVSAVGKISGKFYEGGTNWAFTAASYTAHAANAPDPGESFICSNLVAKFAYKAKKGKKTVTKYATRTFTLVVASDASFPGGVATMTEVVADASRPRSTVEAWQNLWGRAEYKALGKRLFTTKSGKKTQLYKTYTFKGANAAGAAIGLTAAETLSLKVQQTGATTATLSFDTGKTTKDPKTKKKVKLLYTATCSTVIIPTSAADADPFTGGAWVFFAPAPGSGFDGLAGWVPLP